MKLPGQTDLTPSVFGSLGLRIRYSGRLMEFQVGTGPRKATLVAMSSLVGMQRFANEFFGNGRAVGVGRIDE